MNKSAIKNFAVRARNQLIEDITQKAYELGIAKADIKEIEIFEGGFKIKDLENSKTYKKYQIKQRQKLLSTIKEKGFDQTIEEVAYTWFNRFIALRFMEVNEYLPTGVRVLSSIEQGKTEPDIIKEALNIDFDLNPKEYEEYKEIVYRLMDTNDIEDLYRYLMVKQCNQLGSIMPMVFEEISHYTELLLPNNLLAENSIVRDLVESIDEDDYKDQVEIIGWLYQYYISEKKDQVFADLKKNKKITKENIPAATQLFTPKWIVKYMVENSLGRLWLESHPDEELQAQWKYYLEEAEQDPEVQKKLDELKDPNLNPEDITVLDPSMGSGHILVYAFDVLYDIYVKVGYSEREIPQLILEKNLYGLDIDDRAGQLAAFALMMKARSKNRRIFRRKIDLNVCSIQESNRIPKEALEYFCQGSSTSSRGELRSPASSDTLLEDTQYLVDVFHDAKEYGSILDVQKIDFHAIEGRIEEIRDGENADLFELQYREVILEKLPSLVKQGRIMSEKYDVVCTNPPYMGNMPIKMTNYVTKNYANSKYDLYSVFMEKCFKMTKDDSYTSLITQHTWMFISSFKQLRLNILKYDCVNMVHLGTRAFEGIGGEVVQTVAYVFSKKNIKSYISRAKRLVDFGGHKEKEKNFLNNKNNYLFKKEDYSKLPNSPIIYWLSPKYYEAFKKGTPIEKYVLKKAGVVTGNDNYFVRLWHEVMFNEINFTPDLILETYSKYHIMAKGGSHRRFYGNYEYLIRLNDLWNPTKTNKSVRRGDKEFYFKKAIGWSQVANSQKSFRVVDKAICGTATPTVYVKDQELYYYILSFLNTKVAYEYLGVFNPTINLLTTDICNLPLIMSEKHKKVIDGTTQNSVRICKRDWDSFETSWDFARHPLILIRHNEKRIQDVFERWNNFRENEFAQLKSNEEELNRIFIEIYGLQDELTPEVEDKDITIRKADREKDIKSFISYAIGCMFGRYSLDEEGLIYAGGEFEEKWKAEGGKWKVKKKNNEGEIPDIWIDSSFDIVKDNVLVIADDDYFEDDIVHRFVDFVKTTFGEETLEENLDYIAETLGQKASETSRQTIGRYFLKDFYKDHVKTYQKRPIYWLFDSGKKNGFKALIYMHRYDSSTVARVRTDYLHKLQKMYEAEVKRLDILLESDLSAREKAAAMKKKESINKQIEECRTYDQVIAHIANQKIEIDLDDGVKENYTKFQEVEVPQGEGKKPLKANLLAKI